MVLVFPVLTFDYVDAFHDTADAIAASVSAKPFSLPLRNFYCRRFAFP